jgi:multiple sugar transport system substrate-binding protein
MKRLLAAAGVVVLLASACSSTATTVPAPSTASGGSSTAPSSAAPSTATSAAPGPSLAGQSITYYYVQNPQGLSTQKLVPAFEKATGINVNFVLLPEASYQDKLTLLLTAKSNTVDAFGTPTPLTATWNGLDGITPLNPFISDPAQTPASWNAADLPAAINQLCTLNSNQYCVPIFADTTMLYYNKKLLANVGVTSAPQTWADVITAAKALKAGGTSGFCTRGTVDSPNFFTGQMLLHYYLNYSADNKGTYLGPDWKPLLTTPEATAMGQDYQTLMQNAPAGIGSYSYTQCEQDFQQGKLGMWLDASDFTGDVLDPTKSKVASDVGFDVLPCPTANPNNCTMGSPWGAYVNKNSTHQAAAWAWIQYMTSADVEKAVVLDSGNVAAAVRSSVLTSDVFGSAKFPKDLGTALQYGYAHIDGNAFPAIPELVQILTPFGLALSDIVAGKASVSAAFTTANDAITKVLTTAGDIK